MAIRRFRAHIAAQNWFAVGIDVAIVVVGVFLGLQANNWNTERIERAEARAYRIQIIDNLRANEISMADQVAYYEQVLGHAMAALDALETAGAPLGEAFLIDAYQATQVRQRVLSHTAYDEMQAAGLGKNVAGPEIRARMTTYYAQIPQYNTMVLSYTAYRDRVRQAMPIAVQRQMRERCGDIIRNLPGGVVGAMLPARCDLDLDQPDISNAVARIRSTAELNQDLTRHIADIDLRLVLLRGYHRGARELRTQLEALDGD